ncbi:MAG: polysaccharide deacetylase family protein [Gilvibacter sp.]
MKSYPIKIPNLVTRLLPKRRWHYARQEKSIYLTFDDGPIEEITPWVLEQLDTFDAKATFFVIGDNVDENPKIAQDIVAKGHTIGNHTQQHLKGTDCTLDAYLNQLSRCDAAISKALEMDTIPWRLFRPPYGKLRQSQAKSILKKDYRIVMWDVLSADFDLGVTAEQCLTNVINNTQEGSIVVFHDSLKAQEKLRFALPKVLSHFSDLGYAFKCIPLQDR